MDCRRRSLVELCGLRGIKFYAQQHTSVDCTRRQHQPTSWPPTSSSAWTGRMLSGQSTNQTTWASIWCDRWDCDIELKLVLQCYLSVLDSAAPCCRQAVYSGPFRRHQRTDLEIIIAILHWPMLANDRYGFSTDRLILGYSRKDIGRSDTDTDINIMH